MGFNGLTWQKISGSHSILSDWQIPYCDVGDQLRHHSNWKGGLRVGQIKISNMILAGEIYGKFCNIKELLMKSCSPWNVLTNGRHDKNWQEFRINPTCEILQGIMVELLPDCTNSMRKNASFSFQKYPKATTFPWVYFKFMKSISHHRLKAIVGEYVLLRWFIITDSNGFSSSIDQHLHLLLR